MHKFVCAFGCGRQANLCRRRRRCRFGRLNNMCVIRCKRNSPSNGTVLTRAHCASKLIYLKCLRFIAISAECVPKCNLPHTHTQSQKHFLISYLRVCLVWLRSFKTKEKTFMIWYPMILNVFRRSLSIATVLFCYVWHKRTHRQQKNTGSHKGGNTLKSVGSLAYVR